jgi:hypothetical protein
MKAAELLQEILHIIHDVKDDEKELQKILAFLQEELNTFEVEVTESQLPEKYNAVVKEIAGSIDAGFVCFLNTDTLEIDEFPRDLLSDSYMYKMNTGVSLDQLNLKYTKWEKYITIEPLEANESFRIMAKFTDQLDNSRFRTQLVYALNNRKPFVNFKHIIDNSEFRQDWFDFKDKQLQEYVKTMIELEIQDEHE